MPLQQAQIARNYRLLLLFLYAAISGLLPITSTLAATWQDHSTLQAAVRQFIAESFDEDHELDINVGNLDKRLLLEACQGALHAFMPYNKPPLGTVSVGVRCNMPAWKVHIPVQVRAYTQVMVAKQPITRGSLITKADLATQKREISRYHAGTYSSAPQLLGMVAKRNIRQDAVLTPRMLKPRRLVTRGQHVTVIAELNGMHIRTKGEALMDGVQGQIIQVENSRSGKEISGEVIAPSTVRVKM